MGASSEYAYSRVLGECARYRLYASTTEAIVGHIEVEQGAVGNEHAGDSLTPRRPQQVTGEKKSANNNNHSRTRATRSTRRKQATRYVETRVDGAL